MADVLLPPKGYPEKTMSFYITIGLSAAAVLILGIVLFIRSRHQDSVFTDFGPDLESGRSRKSMVLGLFSFKRRSFLHRPHTFKKNEPLDIKQDPEVVIEVEDVKVPIDEPKSIAKPLPVQEKALGRKLSRRELRQQKGTLPFVAPKKNTTSVIKKAKISMRKSSIKKKPIVQPEGKLSVASNIATEPTLPTISDAVPVVYIGHPMIPLFLGENLC
jgi:hypothetical protein